MVTAEQICREANKLPRNALPVVLDFMLFLQKRAADNQGNDLVMAQESSMTPLWDNEEDEAWNEVPTRCLGTSVKTPAVSAGFVPAVVS